MTRLTYRPARPEELVMLNQMTVAGVETYGYRDTFPEALVGLENLLEQGNPREILTVAEEGGEVAGFHGLVPEDGFVELLRMFVTPDRIGKGYGKEIWHHAVGMARKISRRVKIVSDPGAMWFYQAMGAELAETIEVSPGFSLGLFWYEIED
jgi:GNAT superfamily N-acetyltransferase